MRCIDPVEIKEILRLSEMGLSHREIGHSLNCGKSTVGDVKQRCREVGLRYADTVSMTDTQIKKQLYPSMKSESDKEQPDWEYIHKRLKASKRCNLSYLWEEYRQDKPNGFSYSQFCNLYRQWKDSTGKTVTMVQIHDPGKELYVDWVGDTLECVVEPTTGEVSSAHFFVATMGYSCYSYAEAFVDEKIESWLAANVHTLENIGGVPRVIIPDNCKTAITKPHYYEPVHNPEYLEFSKHYGVAIVPARIRKPRDKSCVEGSVYWLESWLLEWLRGQVFYSFEELNLAIKRRLKVLNEKPFQKRAGSRFSEFTEVDRPALRPLPSVRFEHALYITRTVPNNYHVEYGDFYYSVPNSLYKQEVTIRATSTMIEIINHNRERVALHQRRYSGPRYITERGHMPEKHRRQAENSRRTGRDYLNWASTIGVNTHTLIERLLGAQDFEETAYRSCIGVLQWAKKYSPEKLESACGRALNIGSPTYTTVKKLLQDPPVVKPLCPLPAHENLRDPAEFA